MALSGRINGSVTNLSNHFSYYILWTATQDPIANTSTITAKTYWATDNRAYTFDTVGSRDASITIDGTTDSISQAFACNPWPADATYLIQTYSRTVSHGADGTKSLTLSARSNGYAASYGPSNSSASSGDCTASATITLDAIDRSAPTITTSLTSRTANSLVISATSSAACDMWEYSVDGGAWTQFSTTSATTVSCELTGLSPSVTYSIQVRGQKAYNHIVGTSTATNYTTIGAAVLNSATEFYADASSPVVSVQAEVYNSSFTYSLAVKRNGTTLLTLTFPAQSTGTQTLSATLSSAQRSTLLSGMSDVASFSATYELTTLNNGSSIGTSIASAQIKTSASTSKPTAPTFSYADTNASTVAVTGNNQRLIQNKSTLGLTSLSSTAKNGASIASYTIIIGGTTKTSVSGGTVSVGSVPQSGTLTLQVTATDTRGYSNTSSVGNITCYAYENPSLTTGKVSRDDINNTQIALAFTGTFTNVGSNTASATYKFKKTSASTWSATKTITLTVSGGNISYSGTHIEDFDADASYDFVLYIADSLTTETYNFTVSPYEPLVAYRVGGLGIKKVPRTGIPLDVNGTIHQNNVPVDYEFIRGTWAAATNALTGVTKDSALYEGKKIILYYPYAANSSSATLNLTLANGTTTGAKNCYYNSTTRLTTHYGQYAQVEMIYHENFDIGGTNYTGWWCIADRTDLTAYNIRKNSGSYSAYNTVYRYMMLFTKSENQLLAANTTSNNTGTSKVLTTESFDPFGDIYYYSSTTTVSSGSAIGVTSLYRQYNVNLRYAFNSGTTLTSNKAVYIICDPQSDGKVKLSTSPAPITQTLPSSADGKVYIYLGQASSTANCEIALNHPVYYYSNGAIRLWTNDADYVIEEGELYASGSSTLTWQYRKWNSGVAECWCTRRWDYSGNWVSWGNMYCTGWGYGPVYWYPSNFFADVPNFTFTTSSVYSMWVATTEEKSGSNSTKDHMPELIAYRPNNPNAYITITVNIHAIGMSPST